MTKYLIFGIAGLTAVAAVLFMWGKYQGAKADIATLEANLVTMTANYEAEQVARMAIERDKNAAELSILERDAELEAIYQQRDAARQRLREVLGNDPDAQAWADMPVPAGVRELFQ